MLDRNVPWLLRGHVVLIKDGILAVEEPNEDHQEALVGILLDDMLPQPSDRFSKLLVLEVSLQYADKDISALFLCREIVTLDNVSFALLWQEDLSCEYLVKELRRHDRRSFLRKKEV